MSIKEKNVYSLLPRQHCRSGPRTSPAASLTAAIQRARGGPFESNILLCVTSHSSPLGNRNFFTHLIVFLTGNQLCLSLRRGGTLFSRSLARIPETRYSWGRDGEFTSRCAVFLSICRRARSASSCHREDNGCGAAPRLLHTQWPDLPGRPPTAPDVGRPLPQAPAPPHPAAPAQQAQDWERATHGYRAVHFPPPLTIPGAEEEKTIFNVNFIRQSLKANASNTVNIK